MSIPIKPTDFANAIQPHLRPAEKVLWVGRPPQGVWVWPRQSANLRAALAFAVLLAALPILALADSASSDGVVIWSGGGVGLIALLGVLKGDAEWRARVLYAVTDVRALICTVDGRGTANSLPIPNRVRIEKERDNRGTIYIGTASRPFAQIGFWLFYPDKQIVFQAVEDAQRAYVLIRRQAPLQLSSI
ncbi:MAG: hypothetical protein V4514_08585 [Pseudomonadota bacterium]|uniref:hypothetical protein n=1 Tax=Phenylobacterium sp. TaxID=1871053 RepID=UPI0025EFE1D1|nr:hypothetical protein [Phenylobacterium sp.]MBT9471009.1 hypothetical protein [Phenylobacterium sp.]